MFLPIDDYLRQVTVMLANAQDDVRPGRPVEHRVELPKMMGDMFSDGRRNREVAACEFDLHPNAPFFHARSGGDRGGRLPDGSVCSAAFRRRGLVPEPFPPKGGATNSVWTVVGRANRLSNSRADPKAYPYETTCRRSRDPGIFIWSRYLATVRRESFCPSLARVLAISSSVNGLRASSASIIFLILNLMILVETSSPSSLTMPSVKKRRSSITPCGVCAYLPLTTRETVERCMPMSSEMSFSIIGFKHSTPLSRKSRWRSTIRSQTL